MIDQLKGLLFLSLNVVLQNSSNNDTLTYPETVYTYPLAFQLPCIDRLVCEGRSSIANALELRLSCTNLSIYLYKFYCVYRPHLSLYQIM